MSLYTKKVLVNEKGDVGMAKHFSKMFGMKELPIVYLKFNSGNGH